MRLLGVLGVSGLMALLSALAGTGRVEAAGGNTYFVSPTGTATTCVSGNTFNTIGAALSCANQDGTTVSSPDTIIIAAGTYNEHSLDVQADVTIKGTAGSTTIDAQQQGRVMTVQSRDPAFVVSISGLTLKDGLTPTCTEPPGPCPEVVDGGGIINFGTLSITNSTLSGNTASSCRSCVARGGGIFNAGTLSLTNSTLRGNTACGNNLICNGEGGGIFNFGALSLTNSTLRENTACRGGCGDSFGGGIFNLGVLSLTNSTLSGNTACIGGFIGGSCVGEGGGIFNLEVLSLTNSTLRGNTACSGDNCTGFGGGIYNDSGCDGCSGLGGVTLRNDTMTVNAAYSGTGSSGDGGGIYNNSGSLTSHNDTIKNNTPDNCAPPGNVAGCTN